jgi:hypothetical protein
MAAFATTNALSQNAELPIPANACHLDGVNERQILLGRYVPANGRNVSVSVLNDASRQPSKMLLQLAS